MPNYPALLLGRTWHETRHIYQCQDWYVECVAESDEPCAFVGGVDIEHAREGVWLICDESYDVACYASETYHDVGRVIPVHLQVRTVIHHFVQDLAYIVWLVWVIGHDFQQAFRGTLLGVS